MRRALLAAGFLSLMTTAPTAQSHTLVALSHGDYTAYELDPATGRVLHQFTAANEPHEGIASPDGKISARVRAGWPYRRTAGGRRPHTRLRRM